MVILSTKQMPQVVQLDDGNVKGTLRKTPWLFLDLKQEAVEMALSLLANNYTNVRSAHVHGFFYLNMKTLL